MLVTSFVAQDLVALAPALVIVLGADVGTALMARILTFDLSWLSPLLIFIGVIFFLGRKQSRAGQLGRVGIGLGLILLALELIVQAVTPITRANGVQVIFASLTGDILLDALIGAMFAIISYSSLAAVLLTATLTAAGIISFPVALCLVIGANLGSGLLAMLNNSAANAAARRVALGSLLFKLVGSLIILPFVHLLAETMGKLSLPKAELVILFPRLLQPCTLPWSCCHLLTRWHGFAKRLFAMNRNWIPSYGLNIWMSARWIRPRLLWRTPRAKPCALATPWNR